jgi:hypothetical protein
LHPALLAEGVETLADEIAHAVWAKEYTENGTACPVKKVNAIIVLHPVYRFLLQLKVLVCRF